MNKELLDSFAWTNNTGVKPDCEYVEAVCEISTSKFKILKNRSERFSWSVADNHIYKIIKYREISKEDCYEEDCYEEECYEEDCYEE